MIGISEERLIYWFDLFVAKKRLNELDVIRTLIYECQELNQWMPTDENTPKNRQIFLCYPSDGFFANRYEVMKYYPEKEGRKPKYWMELPPDPELPEPPK